MESNICSATTVHAVAECTTVTVASIYTNSRPCASLEELTDLATVTRTTSFIITTVDHSTETVTETVVLTSTSSSFPSTALPTLAEGVGYVETAECGHFCASQLFADIHMNPTCLSITIIWQCVSTCTSKCAYMYTIYRQPTSVVGELSKAGLIWMIVTIFTIVLALIGAGATIVCSLMYFKKWGQAANMSLKRNTTIGEQESHALLEKNRQKEASPHNELLFYYRMNLTTQLICILG